jgi:hypothetical protein
MKFREDLARGGEDVGSIEDIIEKAKRRDQSRPQYKCQPFPRVCETRWVSSHKNGLESVIG